LRTDIRAALNLKPPPRDTLLESVYTKSTVWDYENEWRIVDKQREAEKGTFSDRSFNPQELVAVYFGCRIQPKPREHIIAQISNWASPVKLFQMRDQQLRFELKAESFERCT